jgi:hypothetical protein
MLTKRTFISLVVTGFIFAAFAISLELLDSGKKGFGHLQMFLLRNGLFFLIAGLTALLFPRVINFITNTFSDNEYGVERSNYDRGSVSFSKYDLLLLLLFLIAANLFTIYFISKENYIYFWDEAHFWTKYIYMSNTFKNSPLHAAVTVLTSIHHEYNNLVPFLLAPFSLFFGTDRLPYIFSLVNILVFPTAISFLFLYRRAAGILHGNSPPYGAVFIALFTVFTFPLIWMPTLSGYYGIAGFFLICLILFVYFRCPFSAQRYRTLIVLGIMISTLTLIRRWYSFWAVSFFVSLIINESIFLLADYRFDRRRFIVLAKKISTIIFSSGIFFMMVAAPRFKQIITTDYSYLLLYTFPPGAILGHLLVFFRDFGVFHVTLALSGLILCFYNRNTRKLASFLLIHFVIMFLLFTKVQYFLPHHYYLLQPTIILFIALFMTTLLVKAKSKIIKFTMCSVYVLMLFIIFYVVFFPGSSLYANQAKGLFPKIRHYPLAQNDIDEIKRMLNVIAGLLDDPNDRVYVLSNSVVLTSDILQLAQKSITGTPKIGHRIFRTSSVDLMDGFPSNLFKANYVIVADPIQCELGCNNARIISIPSESILHGKNMGTSYRKLPYEFTIEEYKKKATVYIYERIGPFNQGDMHFLSKELKKYYPDKPFVYQPR